jgi:uncharacterized membrane protein
MIRKLTDHLLKHKAYDIAIVVLITLAATSKWLNAGIPKGHDAVGDMLLAQAASNSFSIHHLVAGWSGDWFLGYPLFSVHPPLVSCLIWALSYPLGWILATKLLYLSFFALSGVFAYLYVFELTRNRPASFAAGLAYVFLPYHVLEVAFEGHHGAFGLPYMLTPLIMLCLERLLQKPGIKYTLINAILIALLTLTYPQVFPFLVGPFLALYVILRIWWQRQRGREYVKSAAISSAATFCLPLLLTAFWWLPLLSEIHYSYASSFSLSEAREFSATFVQAVTLRPEFCCAPASAYEASGTFFLKTLRMLPFVLVALGIVLNRKNRYVWFFSASILIAVLLAMGPDSPIELFSFAHRYVPFFSGVRTPWRFLLFTSLAYAVLIGFCIKTIVDSLGHWVVSRLRYLSISVVVVTLISLIVAGNTWQETRTAFDTFSLTPDQENALAWLKGQDDSDYRITDIPFRTWVWDADSGYIINPTYWTYLHGKQNVYGGVPAAATLYAGETLDYLNYRLEASRADIGGWLSVFNVRYVILDKTDDSYDSVNLGEEFGRVWTSDTIDIYENYAMKPRMFSVSATDERPVKLRSDDIVNVAWAEGSRDFTLSVGKGYGNSSESSLNIDIRFTETGEEYLDLRTDVSDISFDKDDAIRLVFYADDDMPDLYASLDLLEADGSRYGMDLNRFEGIKAGRNEIEFPISMLLPRYSIDENYRLDVGDIQKVWFGIGEKGNVAGVHEFELYFDSLSVVSQETNTRIDYEQISPGKYAAHVSLDSPSCLVLSEAYHPNWIARVNGQLMDSQITFESLNGFHLQPGEYDITLEFRTSSLRTAGTIISGITITLLLLVGLYLFTRQMSQRRRVVRTPSAPSPS